jgi:hypothetical protein
MRAVLSCYVLCAVAAVLALTVAASPNRPNLPTAYRATFSTFLVFTPDFNLTTTNGALAASQNLEAYAQTGIVYGVNVSVINLYKQHVSYTSTPTSCRKKTLASDYSGADPLQLVRFTSFAGLVSVRGIRTQVWLIQSNDMSVAVYVTNTAQQTPVRLFVSTAGYGLQVDYTSFTSGSSARDFQPPKSCSVVRDSEQRRGLDAWNEAAARVESFGEPEAASVAVLHSALSNMPH